MVYVHYISTHVPSSSPPRAPLVPHRGLARCSPWPRLRRWACGNGPATTALVTPARRRHLPSDASDRRRSWSMTPGVRPAVTLVYSARHDGGGGRTANPHPRPHPRLHCQMPPPWQLHCMVGHQVPGGEGKRAPGWGQRRPRMGKTSPRILQR
jgi:hypothetical protein